MASGHLVGKKAWQDLACLFKKKKKQRGLVEITVFLC